VLAKRVLLLTGAPGVGKTTVLQKTVNVLRAKGVSVGGMVSREARKGGVRIGFQVIDVTSGKHGWLAHVDQKTGPQVGKYRVNLEELESIGVGAIAEAIHNYMVVAIDEVGPMELFSSKFKQAVEAALNSSKIVLAVVHAKAREPLIVAVKRRVDAEVFLVTPDNRNGLAEGLAQNILGQLGNAASP
jgi:nucleoside-triphosphatase